MSTDAQLPTLSPRRRRLRATLIALLTLGLLGTGAGWLWYRTTRPQSYRPDEKLPDITSALTLRLPAAAPKPQFTDVTAAVGLASFRTFAGDRTSQLPEDMGPGAAWGDFDNDGDDDLFLVSVGGPLGAPPDSLAPCGLFENLGDGTFRPVDGFPQTRLLGNGAAWGDYDGDGYLDLVVAGYNTLRLFRNEGGSGRFVREPRLPDSPGFWTGVSWGDYNNDRCLDLYVCGYVQYEENAADRDKISSQIGTAVPFTLNPASYPGGLNALWRNNGDGTFTDVAPELGVTNPEGRSLGALWHDFDNDGWLDLYVANDVSDNVFYYNQGGRFADLSHPAYVADYRSAMGLAVADYNRDGDDDLFVGHWVGQENALYDNLLMDLRPKPSSGQPTTSAPNSAGHPAAPPPAGPGPPPAHPPNPAPASRQVPVRFMDLADQKGLGQIALPYVSWGCEFADFDADGWLDLVVVNGNTLEAAGPPPRKLKPQEPFLFWNERGSYFHNLAPLSPPLTEPHVSRGLALADYDQDGDPDILLSHLGEGVQLLRNDTPSGHWLQLRLRSRNRHGAPLGFAEGAQVTAFLGAVPLRRTVFSVSYLSQSSHTLHFGLGPATHVDRLEVRWPAGDAAVFTQLAANARYQITEGDPRPQRVPLRPGAGPVAGGDSSPNNRSQSPAPAQTQAAANPGSAPRSPALTSAERARVLEFWQKQRAAMNAMKIDRDHPRAIELFRQALALDPSHEDSLYYLGHCLAAEGDVPGALAQMQQLQRVNPHSHRAFQQWGVIRALSAQSEADLAAAEAALEQAHAINPEETGALLLLGEIALLRANDARADQRLTAACRSNAKATGGFFLRGYLAWKRGDLAAAQQRLEEARAALGPDWQPKGATSEGDVRRKQYLETTPLGRFWEQWNGAPTPDQAFAPLAAHLRAQAATTTTAAAGGQSSQSQ
ncbi:MAG: tetratricopeptide repeat protein [Verrucomicrobia bacterium]|nr:tetratricopeptide repeat protein [Verrucomicrobiota bacterium]